MKIVDLTHTIHKEILVYPGTKGPEIDVPFTVAKDGFQESLLKMFSHVGTHMDAPAHMVEGASYLDQMSIERFAGQALKLKLDKSFTFGTIREYEEVIKTVDFIIFQTDYDKKFATDAYFEGFPVLDVSITKWLMQFELKGIGIDAISVDQIGSMDMPNHMVLFENNCVIIENLTNLMKLPEQFKFYAMPLNFRNSDGAPVRAFAEVE